MSQEKEWSENPDDDPVELQKRQLELGKKFLDKMEAQEAKDAKREAEYAQAVPAARGFASPVYEPPTFEEISSRIKKAWDEVERVVPTAPDPVKVQAFQALLAGSSGGFL